MRRTLPLVSALVFLYSFGVQIALAQCTVTLGSDYSICPGQSVKLVAKVTNGNPNTFAWTSTPTGNYAATDSIIVTPAGTTTYTVQVSGNGCTATASITISFKVVPATPAFTFSPNDVCSGTAINFNSTPQAGDTHAWNFGDGGNGSGDATSHTYYSYGSGNANFTATLISTAADGCSTSSSQTVSIMQGPDALLDFGNNVDTATFNGFITFYECYVNGQNSAVFNFINSSIPGTGVTSTIQWGDTGATFTTTSPWTNISHIYGIGIYNLTYTVTNQSNGCSATINYRVFFGTNPAGGIGTLGNTTICGPGSLTFYLNNFQSNPPGTLYQIQFNDSTPILTFNQPPPDSIVHYFQKSSCGTSSPSGFQTYGNAFACYLTVSNPCGFTGGQLLPIYVSLSPVAQFTVTGNDTVCQNTTATITSQSSDGQYDIKGNCAVNAYLLWQITPATGWTLSSGAFGSDNGYTGANYDPSKWTPGSNQLNVVFSTLGSYQVRLIAANGCGTPDTTYQTVCVATTPAPAFTLPATTGCAPFIISPANNTPTPNGCGHVNYTWTTIPTGSTCSPDSVNNVLYTGGTTLHSASPNIQFNNEGDYDLILTAQNACGSYNTPAQPITIKDKPQVTVTTPPAICASQTISPSATSLSCAGTISSYSWTFQNGTPATSNTLNPGTISYTAPGQNAISFSSTNECGTKTVNTTVNVDTIPIANAGPNQQICNGKTVQIGVDSLTGYTYTWTPTNGLNSSVISDPTVNLTNNGSTPDSIKYYLAVSNGGTCNSSDSVTVTINPGASANAGPSTSVCAGHSITLNGSFGGAATSATWSSNNGGTFSDSTSITSTYTPSITNGIVTLTLTTNQPVGSCPAGTSTMTVTVISPPVADPGSNQSICSGSSVQLGSNFQFGYNYNWSPPTGLNFTFTSNPTATLTNNTANVTTQTYTLIVSATGCADTASVVVSVYPPAVANAGSPVSVCAGSTISLNGSISGGASSATWSSPSGTFTQPGSLTSQFTPTIASGVAVVTLTTNDPLGPCPAAVSTVSDTVNPLATVTNNPLTQTVCSGSPTQPVILTSALTGTTFSWSSSSPDGVTGFIPSGSTATIPAQTLTNPGFTPDTVIITITPTADACPGIPSTYTIIVNPLPDVILPPGQTICNGNSFNPVTLSSDVSGTTFNWTSISDSFVTGNTLTGTGNIPVQSLSNTGTDTGLVVYTVTPIANNCPGTSGAYPVIINPTPSVTFSPAPQLMCSGQNSQLVNISSATPGATIQWSAVVPTGILSADTSGTSTIPSQTLTDSLSHAVTIQYIARASTSGLVCPGTPANYSITVDPIPQIDFTTSQNNGCTPLFINFVPVVENLGVPDSLIFIWGDGTSNNVLYPNENVPIWNSVQHNFYNNTNQPVTYNVGLEVHNLCKDTIVTHPVTLLPNVITAFFTSSPISGCEPLTVTFQDQSIGAAALSWCFDYDFTNNTCPAGGVVDTPGSTVTHIFSAGSHTVALYVTNGFDCARDTAYQVINVTPAPVAAFSSTNNLCAGTPVTFVQQSTSPSGSLVNAYDWQFGDGDSSTVSSPNHTYDTAGVYNVCLNVTSTFGCSDSICQPVTILTNPIAAFTYVDTCVNTQPIEFVNLSSDANFYNWDFGDGNTASSSDPGHTYATGGTYQVILIASTNSCADTITHGVLVYDIPDAAFSIPVSYVCGAPYTLQPVNNSSGAIGYNWDFGNGQTSTLNNPSVTYNSTGFYHITLSATNQYNCMNTYADSINIYPIPLIQSVQLNPSEGCQPITVQFAANAINANIYNWNFGNGLTDMNDPANSTSSIYSDTGTYSVQLTVYSFQTCGDTLLLNDTVTVHVNPIANFEYSINESIDPENGTVQFVNQSLNSYSYLWNFGDGSTSTIKDPAHLFPVIDSFQVWLYATTAFGCLDSTMKDIYIIRKTLYVPNALAPDFDGSNGLVKIWLPIGAGLKNYHAQIFDKWGELVWESTALNAELSPAEGWDGTYQGRACQEDVYVWKIDASFVDGTIWEGMSYVNDTPRKKVGSITLIR